MPDDSIELLDKTVNKIQYHLVVHGARMPARKCFELLQEKNRRKMVDEELAGKAPPNYAPLCKGYSDVVNAWKEEVESREQAFNEMMADHEKEVKASAKEKKKAPPPPVPTWKKTESAEEKAYEKNKTEKWAEDEVQLQAVINKTTRYSQRSAMWRSGSGRGEAGTNGKMIESISVLEPLR